MFGWRKTKIGLFGWGFAIISRKRFTALTEASAEARHWKAKYLKLVMAQPTALSQVDLLRDFPFYGLDKQENDE